MPGVTTASGTRVYIGGEKTYNEVTAMTQESDYLSESWVEIDDVEDGGELGDQWGQTTYTPLKASRVRKFKTTRDAGDISMVLGMNSSDAGQQAIVAALDSKNAYAFKMVLDDASPGSPASPTTFYFCAKVMSDRRAVGTNENVVRRNVTLAIDSNVVEVEAV